MLSLEVVRQSGSLSVAFSCGIMGESQLESVLADNCSNGDRQLQQGSGSSACLPAVGPLVVAERRETAVSVWTWTQNYVFFVIFGPFCINRLCFQPILLLINKI
jgi:hypothetical protein